jgi:hypothetical protein
MEKEIDNPYRKEKLKYTCIVRKRKPNPMDKES